MGLFSNKKKAKREMQAAMDAERRMYDQMVATQTPWDTLGKDMFTGYREFYDQGGMKFDPNSVMIDPGYDFRQKQGMQGLENSAMARGGLMSGNAMKAAQDYGQNLASQEYGNAYNRAYGGWQDQVNLQNKLLGISEAQKDAMMRVKGQDPTARHHMQRAQQYASKSKGMGGLLGRGLSGLATGGLGGMAGGIGSGLLGGMF